MKKKPYELKLGRKIDPDEFVALVQRFNIFMDADRAMCAGFGFIPSEIKTISPREARAEGKTDFLELVPGRELTADELDSMMRVPIDQRHIIADIEKDLQHLQDLMDALEECKMSLSVFAEQAVELYESGKRLKDLFSQCGKNPGCSLVLCYGRWSLEFGMLAAICHFMEPIQKKHIQRIRAIDGNEQTLQKKRKRNPEAMQAFMNEYFAGKPEGKTYSAAAMACAKKHKCSIETVRSCIPNTWTRRK